MIIIRTLEAIFIQDRSSPNHLNSSNSAPVTPDYFLQRVLLPEVTLCLIAEDMNLEQTDPQVQETLEASREFGAVLFPVPDDLDEISPPPAKKQDLTAKPTPKLTKTTKGASNSIIALKRQSDDLVLKQ